MKVLSPKKDNIDQIIDQVKRVLENDGLVVIPSDTAYGLAADACSERAVAKIYDFKGRRFGKGLSVFIKNIEEIKRYAEYDQSQERIIRTLLPGPFTMILKSRGEVAPAVDPGDGTLGIRVIEQDLVEKITQSVPFPITATSANISGKGPHYSIYSFLATLSQKKKDLIDLVVDVGPLPRRPTSTLVRLVGNEIKVLRVGALNLQLLCKCETKSEAETKRLAQSIYREFLKRELKTKAVVVIMKGDLGVGKTIFAKGIGELFGLELTSPTFVLMDEHPIKGKGKREKGKGNDLIKTLYHLDLFRIQKEEEILELKLKQLLKKGNLMLIEWGEKLSVFEKLKSKNTAFYLLQIEEPSKKRRKFTLYQL